MHLSFILRLIEVCIEDREQHYGYGWLGKAMLQSPLPIRPHY